MYAFVCVLRYFYNNNIVWFSGNDNDDVKTNDYERIEKEKHTHTMYRQRKNNDNYNVKKKRNLNRFETRE